MKARSKVVVKDALARDGKCVRCFSKKQLHVHHIVSLAHNGNDTLDNVDTLCMRCHKEWHNVVEGVISYDEFLYSVPAVVLMIFANHPEHCKLTLQEIEYHWICSAQSRMEFSK